MTLDHAAALHAQMLAIVQTDQSDAECVTAMEDLLDAFIKTKADAVDPVLHAGQEDATRDNSLSETTDRVAAKGTV